MTELEEGIAALRAGDRAKARELIVNVLRQNKEDLCVWMWMYNVSECDKERQHCLEQILRLNSGNENEFPSADQQTEPAHTCENGRPD